jgi:non-homologous end joining protein Ku
MAKIKSITTLEIGADGLFAIPVSVSKIRTQTDVSLDTATAGGDPTGSKPVDAVTGRLLEEGDLPLQKGIFASKPKKSDRTTWSDFKPISPEDLEVIEDATKLDAFTIDHFIPLKDVPFDRVTDAYFLAPAEGHSAKPLVLLSRALKRTKRAGVFKMVKASRQYLAVVYEQDGGLIVNTVAFAADFTAVREAAEVLSKQQVKIALAELSLACDLIEALGSDADVIDTFEDDLIPLKADLVERALAGKELPKRQRRETPQTPTDEESLMGLLEASVKASPARRGSRVPA